MVRGPSMYEMQGPRLVSSRAVTDCSATASLATGTASRDPPPG
jgi:hypothetical protein